jgi:hypothetical protein
MFSYLNHMYYKYYKKNIKYIYLYSNYYTILLIAEEWEPLQNIHNNIELQSNFSLRLITIL